MKRFDYKWILLALLSATYFLAQGTRQIYNAVLPQIKTDFSAVGLNDLQLGLVGSVFTLVFGLVVPFAGMLADFFHRKWTIVVGTLLFSIGIFISGFASGIGLLLVAYGILNAAGQSFLPPSISSLIGQFHVNTRGTAFSIYQMTFYSGIIICSCVSGWLSGLGSSGWRHAFWIFGAAGILWTIVLVFFLKNTAQVKASKCEASGLEQTSESKATLKKALKSFFGQPAAVALMLGLGFYVYATYGFKIWSPMFLLRSFEGMTPARAAFHSVFWFYIGATVGVLLAGRISDRLARQRRGIRMEMNIIGLTIMIPFILLTAFATNEWVVFVGILGFGLATGVYDSNLYAALLDVVNPRYRAVAVGVFGCGGNVLGAFGPGMLGWMNGRFGMRWSMSSLVVFVLVGVLIIFLARFIYLSSEIGKSHLPQKKSEPCA